MHKLAPFPLATLIGLRAFDLVSSRVWWEAATNNTLSISYYTEVQGRVLLFFLDCSTYPWSIPDNAELSKEASSAIFWIFAFTCPGIEPQFPGPLASIQIKILMPILLWFLIYFNLNTFRNGMWAWSITKYMSKVASKVQLLLGGVVCIYSYPQAECDTKSIPK